jgi:glycosyltransferase involved in cell wall biosynthesis
MEIAFLTSGHYPYDDRIFFHLGKTLTKNGHKVEITSSKSALNEVTKGISVNCFDGDNLAKGDKIKYFRERLDNFCPDLIICSEPLPILAAKQYKRKSQKKVIIIYDITEWYPLKQNMRWTKGCLKQLKLQFFNFCSSCFADGFIFGERQKSKPYRFMFPFNPFTFITYYPDLDYVPYVEPSLTGEKLKLSYTGKLSIEKGFNNFISLIAGLTERFKNLKIEIKVIGWYENNEDRIMFEKRIQSVEGNVSFAVLDRQPFESFWELINDTDIFLDLRERTFENHHSLPIKLYYYCALGRPVIYSDLKAIRREVEIEKFGFLVNPDKTDSVIQVISNYLLDKNLYQDHCRNARKLAEEKYNWQKIAPEFIRFIESF